MEHTKEAKKRTKMDNAIIYRQIERLKKAWKKDFKSPKYKITSHLY